MALQADPRTQPPPEVNRIEPTRGWRAIKPAELWRYRELLYFLSWRDVKVRYKQTALGASWAVLQPLITMIILTVVFGRIAGVPHENLPYPIFAFAGLLPWTFFSNGLTQSANSLISGADLVRKIYFPRVFMPVAAIAPGALDFGIAFVLLLGMMAFYGIAPTVNTLWLPLFLLLAVVTAVGVGLWFSALGVRYRDVRYVVPFLVQIWLFATPIAWGDELFPEPWRTLIGLNPMAGVVDGFRWALLGTDFLSGPLVAVSAVTALVVFVGGLAYFARMERTFADVI